MVVAVQYLNVYFSEELLLISTCVFGLSGVPCSVDEGVSIWPVSEQVGTFHVVNSDVHVSEGLWEEVVYLPRHIQDVAHTDEHTYTK